MNMFGKILQAARKTRGLDQAEVAHRSGISTGYLSLLENDKRELDVSILMRILDILGMDIIEFALATGKSKLTDYDREGVIMYKLCTGTMPLCKSALRANL